MSCDISPLCDVAQTSDCGVFLFLTLNISPLCDVAQTSDCGISFKALSRHHFRHSIGLQRYFGISGGLPPDFSFISPMHYYLYV